LRHAVFVVDFMIDGWSIVCDAQLGRHLGIRILALVDRRRYDVRWWTSDYPEAICVWRNRADAQRVCDRFTRHNPRVVRYSDAVSVIAEQHERIQEHEEIV
jgi:hypothetical protein